MKKAIFLLGFLALGACAHHQDVRPGANGVNTVMVRADEDDSGGRDALSQANHYCESIGKRPVILKEKSAYKGSLSEENYKTTRTVGKVASAVGGTVAVFGGRQERKLGQLGLLGGIGAGAVASDGYQHQMSFRCI